MKLLDSHAHLASSELYEHHQEIIKEARRAGVEKIMVITLNPEEFLNAKKLKKEYGSFLDIAYGIFPCDVVDRKEVDWDQFYQITQDEDVKAIGEIGLDYYWDKEHASIQQDGFIRQIKWANEIKKPIIVHSREAMKDTIDLLQEHLQVKGLMHCYSGSLESAKQLINLGMYISFAGPITYKNARGLTEVPPVVPLDKILIETDSPYLTPHPHRGKRNEPKYVAHTFTKICELKNCSEEDLSEAIFQNYQTLFGE